MLSWISESEDMFEDTGASRDHIDGCKLMFVCALSRPHAYIIATCDQVVIFAKSMQVSQCTRIFSYNDNYIHVPIVSQYFMYTCMFMIHVTDYDSAFQLRF